MISLRLAIARLRGLFHRSQSERDLDDELEFHFDREVEQLISQGLSPEEARFTARKRFGGLDRAKEKYRDTRGLPLMEAFFRDLQYGFRGMRQNPGPAAVAILSLGLGIGVNCVLFTLTNAALFRGLPVEEEDRLARIDMTAKGRPRALDYPAFREISERQTRFAALAATGSVRLEHIVYDGVELQEMDRISGGLVSANYFQTLGIAAARGRVFTPADSPTPGTGEVAVLRYGFWESTLGADPSVVGRTIALNGVPFTILGVAPPGFTGDIVGRRTDLWVPILMQPRLQERNYLESRTASFFRTIGRLKPGATGTEAEAEIAALYQQIATSVAQADTGSRVAPVPPSAWRAVVTSGPRAFNPNLERLTKPLALLMGVAGLVLLIACCNVANILLARGAARQHEIATRIALGSSRARLIFQLLTESLLLSVLGGVLGFGLAQMGMRVIDPSRIGSGVLYMQLDLSPDARVLAFTAVVSILTTLIFGIMPALQTTKPTAAHGSPGRARHRMGRALVSVQVALSLWLLIGAGLLLRSLANLRSADIGLDRGHIATITYWLESPLPEASFLTLRREVTERVAAAPQVTGVAHSNYGLFAKGGLTAPARVPASAIEPAQDREMYMGYVSPGFFTALGMEIALGRDFSEQDTASSTKVGIVSEAVARHYFGDRDPIGETVYFPGLDAQNRYIPFADGLNLARRYEIVGVVRDTFDRGPREAPAHRIYLPLSQNQRFAETLYLRTTGDPAAAIPGVLTVLREFSSRMRVEEAITLEQQLIQNYPLELFGSLMLTFFGALALVLAAVGLYGVLSYTVSRRTPEIGVRMALGATSGNILGVMLREMLALVAVGVVIGTLGAIASAGILRSAMFGISPTDPSTIAVVILILTAVAIFASLRPALRAARVNPLTALRHE